MKRLIAVAALAAPLFACGCTNSYDSYRSKEPRYVDDDSYDTRNDPSGNDQRSHARTRPGWSVTESSDVQGGAGPGSYGGHSGTVIRPDGDGNVIIEGESYGR